MGHYHIDLPPREHQLCTVVLLQGEKKKPIGVYNIPDIFQENKYKLFEGLGLERAHIDNIIVITKHVFVDNPKSPIFFQKPMEAELQ